MKALKALDIRGGLGAFVRSQGAAGYASGFITYIVLGLLSLLLAYILRQTHVLSKPGKAAPQPSR